jgi:thioredoxin 1
VTSVLRACALIAVISDPNWESAAPAATVGRMPVTPVTDASFQAEVLESELPVVVDFWAAWCGPCRVMSPILEEIAADRDDLRVVKIDVDANLEVAARYGVMAMPTFMVFRDGAPVGQLVGSRPKRRLLEELSTVI